MQTLYLDVSIPRILLTRLLGRFSSAAYFGPSSPLHFAELPDPPLPAEDWVRVRNRMCGICGSDLHQLFVDAGLDVAPVALPAHKRIYLGHEMVGEIVELGQDVSSFTSGERVVRWGRADDCLSRGRSQLCPPCRRGHRVLCQYASEPRQYYPVGGGFGDSFITPAASLVPVPDALSDEQAIFTEPVAVAIHAATRRPARPGEQILVLGVGTIGFLMIQTIRAPRAIIALAYDSGGVTTSTVTVPLVTALGLGLASTIPGRSPLLDGFGLIAFASLFPIMSVIAYAQIAEWRARRSNRDQENYHAL